MRSITLARLALDYFGLKKIEELRKGGEIQYMIICRALIQGKDLQLQTTESRIDGRIPKSDWVEKFLPTFDYKKSILIEIPSMPSDKFPKMAAYLDDAWKKRSMGEFSDVLVDCRRSLEEAVNLVKDKGFLTEDKKADWSKFLGDKELGDINGTIMQKLTGFVAPGAHSGQVFNIEDADYALLITHAITNYILAKIARTGS
jgi:hypothetical protein